MTNAAISPDDGLDLVFQALANRTRRALLARLRDGPAKVTDLAKPFGMSLNAISKHLFVLERASLIDRRIDGRIHICALNAGPLSSAEDWLQAYRDYWSANLDGLAAFLESNSSDTRK